LPPAAGHAKLLNLTSHNVRIHAASGETIDINPSGHMVRVAEQKREVAAISVCGESIPIRECVLGDVSGLPPYRKDVLCIVSRLVAEAVPDRGDLVYPDQALKERGPDGSTVYTGCRALARTERKPSDISLLQDIRRGAARRRLDVAIARTRDLTRSLESGGVKPGDDRYGALAAEASAVISMFSEAFGGQTADIELGYPALVNLKTLARVQISGRAET
jgi:hypothetical protein